MVAAVDRSDPIPHRSLCDAAQPVLVFVEGAVGVNVDVAPSGTGDRTAVITVTSAHVAADSGRSQTQLPPKGCGTTLDARTRRGSLHIGRHCGARRAATTLAHGAGPQPKD